VIVPNRTPEGDAFSRLAVRGLILSGLLDQVGNGLTEATGQSAARWKVLAAVEAAPLTVAQVARALRQTRQGIQRLADALSAEDLTRFVADPGDRRADLLTLTDTGRSVLSKIQAGQRQWADRLGAALGLARLETIDKALTDLIDTLERDSQA
jgi:DNA-binding MarR family transcriptional regulator